MFEAYPQIFVFGGYAFVHGSLDPPKQLVEQIGDDEAPCIRGVKSYDTCSPRLNCQGWRNSPNVSNVPVCGFGMYRLPGIVPSFVSANEHEV